MIIRLYGDIDNKTIKTVSADFYNLYDPNGYLENDERAVVVKVELKLSKNGNLVAIVKDKSNI